MMSTTNPSSCFKGLEQKITRAVEGKLQGVQAEVKELERKSEVADGKTQAHYHAWLEKLNWDWEALHEELARRKEEGTPSTPKPSMPSPESTLRWKEPAIPSGFSMLRTSPWVVLKNLGAQLGEPQLGFFTQGTGSSEQCQGSPSKGEAELSSEQEGNQRSSDSRKEYRGPRSSTKRPPRQHFPVQNTAGQGGRVGSSRKPWNNWARKGKQSGRAIGPGQGLLGTCTALPQRQECPWWWSHPEATSLPTGHRGTLKNVPVPDHQAPYLQATPPEACLGDWPGHEVRSQVSGVCQGSLTRICQGLLHRAI